MKTHSLKVSERVISYAFNDRVISRNVKADQLSVTFDKEWESTTSALAVFAGSGTVVRLDISTASGSATVTVPWEVLQRSGALHVSFVGYFADGQRIVTQKMARPLIVADGGEVDGGDAADPSPDVVKTEIAKAIKATEDAAAAAKSASSAAKSASTSAAAASEATDAAYAAVDEAKGATSAASTAAKSASAASESASAAAGKANAAAAAASTEATGLAALKASCENAAGSAESAASAANAAAGKADAEASDLSGLKKSCESATKAANEAAASASTAAGDANTSAEKADTAAQGANDAKTEALKAAEEARGSISPDKRLYIAYDTVGDTDYISLVDTED